MSKAEEWMKPRWFDTQPPASNAWEEAVLEQLVAHGMDAPVRDAPAKIVKSLIDMAVTMALDPAINPPASNAEREALREALTLALEYWRDRQQRYKNRHPVWVEKANAALATKPQAGDVAQDSDPDCPNCSGPRFCTKRECNEPDAARTRDKSFK